MNYNPDIHYRRSIRLKGYDYAQAGLYFVTICTQDRLCLFGEIKNGEMILNDAGIMIGRQCQELIYRFDNIKSDEFIVMPNHFHGIVKFVGVPLVGTQNTKPKQPPTIGSQNTKQPSTIGSQPLTIGQPQGIAPTEITESKIEKGHNASCPCK